MRLLAPDWRCVGRAATLDDLRHVVDGDDVN
jgi:hypothetical protein